MPIDENSPGDHAAAARRLRHLLTFNPDYRARWERHVQRRPGKSEIHQAAVAHVLAHHLWDTGQVPESDLALVRRLKDVVSRALSGRVLSARTLRLITEAFAMSPSDVAALAADRTSGSVATGVSAGTDVEPMTPTGVAGPGLRTIILHEFLTLGPDGMPTRNRTVHLLQALAPLESYQYYLDTDRAEITMVRGGSCGPVVHRSRHPTVTITLVRPLLPGETASVEFLTEFSYAQPPDPIFLRGGGTAATAEQVEILLQFPAVRLPESLWWVRRPNVPGAFPQVQEKVHLDPEHRVHRHLQLLTGQHVGFRWQYPDRWTC